MGGKGSAAGTPLPFASAEERARFEAALSAGTALAGPEAAESADAWARAVEAAGALDDTIALLEVEAGKKAAPPQVAFALAALYGRKGLERQEYAALSRAEDCAKGRPELAFNLAAVYGRK
ncbi:MAG: hypothetical protein JNG85_17370 [Spirochaetaceae bacterium]|nr:hypothetical protein [Spirochaetaceae bacterium]